MTSITSLPLSATIALLYPVFFHRVVNQYTGYHTVRTMCNNEKDDNGRSSPFGLGGNDMYGKKINNGCWETRSRLMNEVEHRKHNLLLFIGLAGVLGSLMFVTPGTTQTGLGWGGVITLFVAIVFHWHIYNEQQKLLLSGGALAVALYFSSQMMGNNDYSTSYLVDPR